MNERPCPAYFCELDAQPLRELFADPQVIPFLVDTRASVCMGIRDLSPERAEVMDWLNKAGVPVTAWLLLPDEQGYWFNLDNAPQALERYGQFLTWSKQHNLNWARIGIDIEPDIRLIQGLSQNRLNGLVGVVRRAFDRNRLRRGRALYRELMRQIHSSGYSVEVYHFPFIIDERMARSNVLQRLTSLVELPEADHEVFMLYSSYLRPWGQGLLWSYAPQSESIAVGSTGGGVELGGALKPSPLNWPELQIDLLLASQHTSAIYIFSLEGCVRQGFLPKLRDFDWRQPVAAPYEAARRVYNVRKTFQRVLWLMARPAWILFGLAMLVSLISLLTHRKN